MVLDVGFTRRGGGGGMGIELLLMSLFRVSMESPGSSAHCRAAETSEKLERETSRKGGGGGTLASMRGGAEAGCAVEGRGVDITVLSSGFVSSCDSPAAGTFAIALGDRLNAVGFGGRGGGGLREDVAAGFASKDPNEGSIAISSPLIWSPLPLE